MTTPLLREFKSVVLTSKTPEITAAFYRDVLDLPLEAERHRGTLEHWTCQVGSLHFAIHDLDSFWLPSASDATPPATIVSFTVDDVDAVASRLSDRGVAIVARTKIGPMSFIAVRDPDGRHVCFGTPWPAMKRAPAEAAG